MMPLIGFVLVFLGFMAGQVKIYGIFSYVVAKALPPILVGFGLILNIAWLIGFLN